MDNFYGIVIICVLLYLFFVKVNFAGFSNDKSAMYEEIIKHKDLFDGQNYSKLKKKITWMDAGIYNDVKLLTVNKTSLNHENLSVIFRKNLRE